MYQSTGAPSAMDDDDDDTMSMALTSYGGTVVAADALVSMAHLQVCCFSIFCSSSSSFRFFFSIVSSISLIAIHIYIFSVTSRHSFCASSLPFSFVYT
jgi:hypothetical protein